MKHLFEFYMKHPSEEHPIQAYLPTKSARFGKVGNIILGKVNEMRSNMGLEPWKKEDLTEFKLREISRH